MKYTVKELADALSSFDPDLPVTLNGYEGGHTESVHIEVLTLSVNVNDGVDYYGEHDEPDPRYPTETRTFLNLGRHPSRT